MVKVMCTVLGLALLGLGVPCLSQEVESMEVFLQRLTLRPTGKNGLEELATAYQICRSEKLKRLEDPALPLDQTRALLMLPDAVDAYKLIERGLEKPIRIPASMSPLAFGHVAIMMRSIARTIAARQRLDLADGNVRRVAHAYSLGLKLARSIRTQSIIGWLVAIAVERIPQRRVEASLLRLSAEDCRSLLRDLSGYCLEPGALKACMLADLRHVLELTVRSMKGASERDRARASAMDRADYKYVFDNLSKPFIKWPPVPKPPAGANPTEDQQMGQQVLINSVKIIQTDLGKTRLFATRIALQLHRKTHKGRLPAMLAELKIGELAVEPLTGLPFKYIPHPSGDYILVGN